MSDVIKAHKHSIRHRSEIMNSTLCGCFHCLEIYQSVIITEWVDWPEGTPADKRNEAGDTALCPYCSIDSVIGDKSGFPITKEFLSEMQKYWFDGQ